MSLLEALKQKGQGRELPLVPLRDLVVFPRGIVPIFIITKSSLGAVDWAMLHDKKILVSLELSPSNDKPDSAVHPVGTVAHVIQQIKLPDGTNRLLIEGEHRAEITAFAARKDFTAAEYESIPEDFERGPEIDARMRNCKKAFLLYTELVKKIAVDVVANVERAENPHRLVDLIGASMVVRAERKQALLSGRDAAARLDELALALEGELEVLGLQKKISTKVKSRIDRSQREYFLSEQLKEINRELGREGDESETKELERLISARNPGEEVMAKARKELSRLSKLQPMSPEAGVLRGYLEWIADLPWRERTQENKDLDLATRILDEDHYALDKAKERILEFIAVRQLKDRIKGPILCFVGPPGTGKTSLGRSVARALGRNFVRISLGGIRDEGEIRGHRKTYVGALPGKIIQSMKRAGATNPVFLLDEIDKMSSDFRGDPASALLEVLDPEQNKSFQDHYLELPYDLSDVMFITTANSLHTVPFPLLDRMEVIEVPGYSEFEKVHIAQRFIVPKALAENGLEGAKIDFQKAGLLELIRHYTLESGVRNLEREIARVVRKLAQDALREGFGSAGKDLSGFSATVTPKFLAKRLGPRKHEDAPLDKVPKVGVVCGLAWTEMGGTLLPVESTLFDGTGELILTGNLGDVMKESARTALSRIRSAMPETLPAGEFKKNVHVHVPQGAIPKDGPSAGITILCSLLSAITGKPPLAALAMTGEITLSGRILPIGGIKEKVLAAHRHHMTKVLLPEANRKDLQDIPKEVAKDLEFVFCSTVEEALGVVFPGGEETHG